jgi:murein L,D-transpeptidase YafK
MDFGEQRDYADQPSRLAKIALVSLYLGALVVLMLPRDGMPMRGPQHPPASVLRAAQLSRLPAEIASAADHRAGWWQRQAANVETGRSWWPRATTTVLAAEPWWRRHAQHAALDRGWWQRQVAAAGAADGWWQRQARFAAARGGWWQRSLPTVLADRPWWRRQVADAAAGQGWWQRHARSELAVAGGGWWQHHRSARPVVETAAASTAAGAEMHVAAPIAADQLAATSQPVAVDTGEQRRRLMLSLASIASPVVSELKRFTRLLTRREPLTPASPPTAPATAAAPTVGASPRLCIAHDIAGWDGETLDDARRSLLQRVAMASVPASDAETGDALSDDLLQRLQQRGFEPGAAVYLRIFKDRSSLEVWLRKGDRFALFQRYDICRWSGTYGPKLYEGDRQSPEGYYLVDDQLFNRRSWKWKNSFTINYPNTYDKLHGRTGSYILVHGGCTSSGCFAMTNPVIEEVHELATLARESGQDVLDISVYPFPLTERNLREYGDSPWSDFWRNLKEGYDLFEATHLPPRVRVCGERYHFAPGGAASADADAVFPAGCQMLVAAVPGWRQAPAGRLSYREARNVRLRATSGHLRCNLGRASCRKWAAMAVNRHGGARSSVRRDGMLRSAYGIGKRK